MTEQTAVPEGLVEQLRRFDANARWANLHEWGLQRYKGRFVAVDGEELIGVADSEADLRMRFPGRPALYVAFVSPPELDWIL